MYEQLTPEEKRLLLADLLGNPDAENLGVAQQIVGQPANAFAQQELPQNYFQRSGGQPVDLGPSRPQFGGQELDYGQSPVEYMGQKGYRVKGDPMTVVLQDGRRVMLGVDQTASRKRQAEDLKLEETRADIEGKRALTDSRLQANARTKALNVPEGMPMPPKDHSYNMQGELVVIPGSPTYKKQLEGKLQHETQMTTHTQWIDAALKDINMLIGDPEQKMAEHPGLQGSVGYLDTKLPPINDQQATAQAIIKALLAKSSVQGLQGVRQSGTAPGSITEKEWPIFQNLIGTIDPNQDEGTFRKQLADLRTLLKESKQNVSGRYQQQYGGQAAAPVVPPPSAPTAPTAPSGNIPPAAIQMLRGDPRLRGAFDAKYGPGAAAQVLGN